MNCKNDNIAIAILAGGDGSRIGGYKPLRRLGGITLIGRARALAQSWSANVVIVGRDPAQVGPTDLPFIRDEPGSVGPIAGLAAALRHAMESGHDGLLTIPCDSPFLPCDLVSRLANALASSAGAAVPSSDGFLHPACALWRASAFFALSAYIASGRRSLHGFAEHMGFVTVEWPSTPVDPFLNINSKDDLAAAEILIGR